MTQDDEEEIPEWEMKEEEIPPSLRKRWDREEESGARGGVCRHCGAAFTYDDLTCRVCDEPVELPAEHVPPLARFFGGPWAALIAAVVLAAMVLLFVL